LWEVVLAYSIACFFLNNNNHSNDQKSMLFLQSARLGSDGIPLLLLDCDLLTSLPELEIRSDQQQHDKQTLKRALSLLFIEKTIHFFNESNNNNEFKF